MSQQNREPVWERACGRWRSVLLQAGIPAAHLTGKHGPCPICQEGKDRFRFTDHNGTGSWVCNVCGNGTGTDLIRRFFGIGFKEAAERIEAVLGTATRDAPTKTEPDHVLRQRMNDLWKASAAIRPGDVVTRYMASRGIVLREWPKPLRFVNTPRCFGMVAKVINSDNVPVNIHRTFLTRDGQKDPEKVRKVMKGECPAGSAIRLFDFEEVLGVAEGIETAISASLLYNVPVWSLLNANGIKEFQPPKQVKRLMVFADNDENYVGQHAAFCLAMRARTMKIDTEVLIPAAVGDDWNDVLIRKHEKSHAA
ncbi:toprim domain-containing protein [Azospirillum sp. A26]|uniref:toprim domain-containing protein n=1 Tax=Azospirillum sp. A26 TaxID=3160607 RepID=UPI003673583A